tara:strand:+ start:25 stop:492 length:468 start_codon:yes stop_codon:yes gene_type:complete
MASTSTNKQPLLVDSVLHTVVNLDSAYTATMDVSGTNTAVLIVNAVSTDGAIVEDIYSIARSTTAGKINLYLSSATDYLRSSEGVLIGQFNSGTTVGAVTSFTAMPRIIAPVAHAGGEAQLRALYIPKGKALWAARESSSVLTDGPLLGVQGGWY